jgi:hypothetical protein
MIKYYLVTLVLIATFVIGGCGKKETEKPNAKFLGSYQVKDVWASSKPEIGSGSLEYELTIQAKGDSSVVIDNINKTLFGIYGVARGDTLYIASQTGKSKAGKSYDVGEQFGYFSDGKLVLSCDYHDLYLGNLIGSVSATMVGSRITESK